MLCRFDRKVRPWAVALALEPPIGKFAGKFSEWTDCSAEDSDGFLKDLDARAHPLEVGGEGSQGVGQCNDLVKRAAFGDEPFEGAVLCQECFEDAVLGQCAIDDTVLGSQAFDGTVYAE